MWWLWLGCVTAPVETSGPGGEGLEPTAGLDRTEVNNRPHASAFWISDKTHPNHPDADELVPVWLGDATLPMTPPAPNGPVPGDARQRAVAKQLARGRSTLVLTTVEPDEKAFVRAMLQVADALEELHDFQLGSAGIEPAPDAFSAALDWRAHGPWCGSDEACRATEQPVEQVFGLYPANLQTEPEFCAALEKQDGLMDPFTVVRDGNVAIPYSEAWPEASKRAATALETAAAALPETEKAMAGYLRAAAQAFGDNDWFAADAVWLTTRGESEWYVRVGPDETYWEPCDRKAGYHLVFARVNPASVRWESVLEPKKGAMELALAKKAAPYPAREVAFSLPEFIDIVVNAGDARQADGATIGQSLPNWGPVAEAGGRTVAMTNLNNDADSLAVQQARAESLFCSAEAYTNDPEPLLFSTLLHEAAHNLGPASGYQVNGKTDEALFGGELATMLEELKAQTAALYLTDWLAEQEVIEPAFAQQAHMADLLWGFGKLADGMTDANGGARAYPQLAAIQVGLLEKTGAVTFEADRKAANGKDTGCFEVHLDLLERGIDQLADTVLSIKGQGDVEGARALKAAYVDGLDPARLQLVRERWNRAPRNVFVYGFSGL